MNTSEIQQSVETVVNSITQLGIDMGIPFDVVPDKSVSIKWAIANLQCHVQWAIFIITLAVGMFNNLIRSSLGSVRQCMLFLFLKKCFIVFIRLPMLFMYLTYDFLMYVYTRGYKKFYGWGIHLFTGRFGAGKTSCVVYLARK